MIRRLELRRWHVTKWLQQSSMIEPVNPFERGVLDGVRMSPRPATVDDLGLVELDDGLGERVVVRVTDAAHRRLSARLSQPLRVANRQVLATSIAVMDDALDIGTRPQRLLQGIQDQLGAHRACYAPANDA